MGRFSLSPSPDNVMLMPSEEPPVEPPQPPFPPGFPPNSGQWNTPQGSVYAAWGAVVYKPDKPDKPEKPAWPGYPGNRPGWPGYPGGPGYVEPPFCPGHPEHPGCPGCPTCPEHPGCWVRPEHPIAEIPVCEWPIDTTCLPTPATPEDEAALEAAVELAINVLWALSGRQYGVCPAVARPCPLPSLNSGRLSNPYGGAGMSLVRSGGEWANESCGCAGRCRLSGPRMVHLPGPVQGIIEVNIAGTVLNPSEYELEKNILYRNGSPWPYQDLSRPLYEEGTWSVTYMRGVPVPNGLARLTGLLVNEFYMACSGGKCRLPRTVTEVSRQGVTHRMYNPNDIYSTGKTGIPEIDLWLSAVNPHAIMSAPTVY